MNYILLIIILFTSAPIMAKMEPIPFGNGVTIIKSTPHSPFVYPRPLVAELTDNNPKVLAQFDELAWTLVGAWAAGLDDKDFGRILDALAFAAEKHRFQTRKDPGATPYIIHPLGVANSLMKIGNVNDPDIIIGALLHDTVEDTETTLEEVEAQFGPRVAGFVREVTDNKALPKKVRKQLQIEHAPHKSAGAAQIKLADKLYNLTDLATAPPADWERERVDTYFRWAEAVVDGLPKVNASLKGAVDQIIATYWEQHE